jgi:hypothetical protein
VFGRMVIFMKRLTTTKESIMSTKNLLASLAVLLLTTSAGAEPTAIRSEVAPISNALEIAIGGAYMQGAGDIGAGMASVEDLQRGGGGAELQLGYRLTPNWTIGGYATLSGYDVGRRAAPSTDLVVGSTLGVKVDYHYRPAASADPWISVGTGWRGMWLGNDAGTEVALQGIELTRIQAGIDYRFSPSFALTPYIGAGASIFLQKDDMNTKGYESISGKELNWSFTGGLMARFDVLGTRGR